MSLTSNDTFIEGKNKISLKPHHLLGPIGIIVNFYIVTLVFLTISRLMLMIWQSERTLDNAVWPQILLNGLRIDISSVSYLFLIPLLITFVCAFFQSEHKLLRAFLKYWLVGSIALFVFFEAITPTFILEYDLRPNRLFIEYLIYPKEVFSMLFTG